MSEIHAQILRGKRRGEIIEIHQYCNDWCTDTQGKVWGLRSLFFDLPGRLAISDAYKADRREKTTKRCGQMFNQFSYPEFIATGKFKRRKI